ncbi:hypothetical protein PG991_005391 [Apiospora marii]|uniref:Knr4/Smi1-like domain-containing protein n=1 Tax=Apiospora marii TaxID=335849 RepID=A0ABR1SAB2_9PEZI
MPELEDVSYSEAECVAAIADYYEFLTKMYLDESEVIYPPKGGWPSITQAHPEVLARFGKTDTVISLLAHLPYIRNKGGAEDGIHAIADCPFADWDDFFSGLPPDSDLDSCKMVTESYAFTEVAPPHVVGLAAGHRDASIIIVDTELGIIHWDQYPYRNQETHIREPIIDDPYDWAPEEEAEWRAECEAWAITDFFEVLKGLYVDLHFIPVSNREVLMDVEGWGHPPGLIPMLQKIYFEHRWPDLAAYRKEDCLRAVHEAIEANYPDL